LEDAGAIAPSALPRPSSGESSTDDRVDLSHAARLRQRLRADVGDVTQMDATRVASLRARVSGETYKPAPEAVASSLITELTGDHLV
jgi:anti-sigma28 factor (negative regulator of flagellin synthesis)